MLRWKPIVIGATGGFALLSGLQAIGSGMVASSAGHQQAEGAVESPEAAAPALASHVVEACKATMAVMNSRDATTFTGHLINDTTAHVSWVRPDDGKRWQARCEVIDENHIRWAAFDAFGDGKQGRWRDEDRIEVLVRDAAISISLEQSGLGERTETFPLSKLT
ncbi:MAG TPA: hypothetical protein PKN09_01215 [Novosphingobium sp.]|nr:hypothetical protein [Novosphingobium sp.]